MKKIPSPQTGFTLVEMLIVVALVGLLVGMAIPSFVKSQRYARVSNRANLLFFSLMKARSVAIKKQRPVLVIITPATVAGVKQVTFKAVLDADFGQGGAGISAGDQSFSVPDEDPFPGGVLILRESDIAFGFPNATTSAYDNSKGLTNLVDAQTAPFWLEFAADGRLLPDGRSPFPTTADITQLSPQPPLATALPGGPEFYFAEYNAVTHPAANSHVYRKIVVSPLGAVQVKTWNSTSKVWGGVQ